MPTPVGLYGIRLAVATARPSSSAPAHARILARQHCQQCAKGIARRTQLLCVLEPVIQPAEHNVLHEDLLPRPLAVAIDGLHQLVQGEGPRGRHDRVAEGLVRRVE